MLDWLKNPTVTFLLGAIIAAILREFVSQWFGRPRIRLAVSDVWMSPSPHPSIKAIRSTNSLSRLLRKIPLETIGWEDTDFSAITLDKAILETIDTEEKCKDIGTRILELRNDWDSLTSDPAELIYRIACNKRICGRIIGALINFPDQSPKFATPSSEQKPIFSLHVQRDDDGNKEFVQLDLPGNAWPVVGHPLGIPDLNKQGAALAYALSYGDLAMLRLLVDLGWRFNQQAIQQMLEIRKELRIIRAARNFLHVQIILTNLGKEPTALYSDLRIELSKINEPIELNWMRDEDPATSKIAEVEVEEYSQSISIRWPSSAAESAGVGSILSFIPLKAGEASTLRFVSRAETNKAQSVAVEALRNKLLTCKITLHASRSSRGWRFLKKRTGRQRLIFNQNLENAP